MSCCKERLNRTNQALDKNKRTTNGKTADLRALLLVSQTTFLQSSSAKCETKKENAKTGIKSNKKDVSNGKRVSFFFFSACNKSRSPPAFPFSRADSRFAAQPSVTSCFPGKFGVLVVPETWGPADQFVSLAFFCTGCKEGGGDSGLIFRRSANRGNVETLDQREERPERVLESGIKRNRHIKISSKRKRMEIDVNSFFKKKEQRIKRTKGVNNAKKQQKNKKNPLQSQCSPQQKNALVEE